MPQGAHVISPGYIKEYTYIGIIQKTDDKGMCQIFQRNKFSVGEEIEIMDPEGGNLILPVLAMETLENGQRVPVDSAPHPRQEIWIDFGQPLETGWLLRRKENS